MSGWQDEPVQSRALVQAVCAATDRPCELAHTPRETLVTAICLQLSRPVSPEELDRAR